jgi:hypothetical protein
LGLSRPTSPLPRKPIWLQYRNASFRASNGDAKLGTDLGLEGLLFQFKMELCGEAGIFVKLLK